MAIYDTSLIGEMAAAVTTTMQAIKAHPNVKGSAIPLLSVGAGIVFCVCWFLVTGNLDSDIAPLHIEWSNIYKALFDGVAAAVIANAGFNIQKYLPIPNILPTAQEIDDNAMKEAVHKSELVAQGVSQGVPPDDAKKIVGLNPITDPPSDRLLQAVAPPPAAIVAKDMVAPAEAPNLQADATKKET